MIVASKNFATKHGQSHNYKNQHHTTASIHGFDEPFTSNRIVVVTLEQKRTSVDYFLSIRMTPDDAKKLAEALLKASEQNGFIQVPTL